MSRPALVLSILLLAPGAAAGQGAAALLERLDGDLRLGSLEEGPGGDAFGLIADVKEGADGSFYVLDTRLHQLKRFSAEGRLLAQAGRSGRGPGEFRAPMMVQVADSGTLLLLDPGNARLNSYDADLDLLAESSIPGPFIDFCLLGERIFFHGLFNGLLIHELDTEGGSVRSFAPAPEPPGDFPPSLRDTYQRSLGRGRIVCDPGTGSLIHVAGNTPSITAYDPAGSLLWEAEIPEYRQMRLVAGSLGGRPGVQHLLDPETNSQHSLGSVNLVSPTRLLVQLGVIRGYGGEMDDGEIHSWFLDPATGTFTQQTGSLPRVLAVGQNALYFVGNVPYPMLVRAGRTVLDGA